MSWGPARGGVCLIAPPSPREQAEQFLHAYRVNTVALLRADGQLVFSLKWSNDPVHEGSSSQAPYERVKGW